MHWLHVFSAFHLGSSRWKPNLATRSRHYFDHAAFHLACPGGSESGCRARCSPKRSVHRDKLGGVQAIWNRRRDLVARRGFHPRKVDGVPGNMKQSYMTHSKDEQKWHNSSGEVDPRQYQIFNSPGGEFRDHAGIQPQNGFREKRDPSKHADRFLTNSAFRVIRGRSQVDLTSPVPQFSRNALSWELPEHRTRPMCRSWPVGELTRNVGGTSDSDGPPFCPTWWACAPLVPPYGAYRLAASDLPTCLDV